MIYRPFDSYSYDLSQQRNRLEGKKSVYCNFSVQRLNDIFFCLVRIVDLIWRQRGAFFALHNCLCLFVGRGSISNITTIQVFVTAPQKQFCFLIQQIKTVIYAEEAGQVKADLFVNITDYLKC